MTLLGIIDEKEIRSAQTMFEDNIRKCSTTTIDVKIGYKGENVSAKVCWSDRHKMWWYTNDKITTNRYWNAFGLANNPPKSGEMVDIICEVNIPFKGTDKRIGGTFAKDDSDKIWIVHNGKIGGGRVGIGKKLFWDNYEVGNDDYLDDGRHVVKICSLDSIDLCNKIRDFVLEIKRIKEKRRSP